MVKVIMSSYVDSSFIGEVEQEVRPQFRDILEFNGSTYLINKLLKPDLWDSASQMLKIRVRVTKQ